MGGFLDLVLALIPHVVITEYFSFSVAMQTPFFIIYNNVILKMKCWRSWLRLLQPWVRGSRFSSEIARENQIAHFPN